MTHKPETLASTDLTVKELDQAYGITEEELASVSIVCTCTCGLPFVDAARATEADAESIATTAN